jgi:hypothetical protein
MRCVGKVPPFDTLTCLRFSVWDFPLLYSIPSDKHICKVKPSRYSPRVAQRVPGSYGSQITWQRHRMVLRLSALRTDRLYPQKMLLVLISVRGGVDPMAIVRSEGLCQWKIPMTQSGIEPATFWFVAQYLNHCATISGPPNTFVVPEIREQSLPPVSFEIYYALSPSRLKKWSLCYWWHRQINWRNIFNIFNLFKYLYLCNLFKCVWWAIGKATGCGLYDQGVNLGKVQCHFSIVPTDMRTRERKVIVVGERAKIPAADGNSVLIQHVWSETVFSCSKATNSRSALVTLPTWQSSQPTSQRNM